MIRTLREEKSMTQKDLTNMLNITDKAVSKWERDVACPDTLTIPKFAEILEVSVDELMGAKSTLISSSKETGLLIHMILKAVPVAIGVAVATISILGELSIKSGFTMLGIDLACAGIYLLSSND